MGLGHHSRGTLVFFDREEADSQAQFFLSLWKKEKKSQTKNEDKPIFLDLLRTLENHNVNKTYEQIDEKYNSKCYNKKFQART